MPARTYMVVDPRRDHSFRVPRPDLSAALGHAERLHGLPSRTARPSGPPTGSRPGAATRPGTADFARALDAARRGLPDAGPALIALATDRSQPGIVRATALSHLPEFSTPGDGRPRWRARSAIPTPWSGWAALRAVGRRCRPIGGGRWPRPSSAIP